MYSKRETGKAHYQRKGHAPTPLRGRFRLTPRKDMAQKTPFAETPEAPMSTGFDDDLDEGMRKAVRDMIDVVAERGGITRNHASMLLTRTRDKLTRAEPVSPGMICVTWRMFGQSWVFNAASSAESARSCCISSHMAFMTAKIAASGRPRIQAKYHIRRLLLSKRFRCSC
jgi:hypothetical protein